jgi:chorismate synthase
VILQFQNNHSIQAGESSVYSNSIGNKFKITTFGESHGIYMGVVIDGVKPNLEFDMDLLMEELKKRAPGRYQFSTSRNEPDIPEIISGVFNGKTLGTPICILIKNKNSRSIDYKDLMDIFRPGHGGYTWMKKYGIRDYRGGGRSSGRETVSRVAGGAVAKMILNHENIKISSLTVEIAGIKAQTNSIKDSKSNILAFCDNKTLPQVQRKLKNLKQAGDSSGAVVEITITGVKPGIGDPVFQKLEANLAAAIISIGGVKGIEFGAGFLGAAMKGSDHNDPITPDGFSSNNSGGFLGGISTGQPIIIKVAIKPVSSISIPQNTIDIHGSPVVVSVTGRHDTVLVPRIIPVLESMVAITIVDALFNQKAIDSDPLSLEQLRKTIEDIDADILLSLKKRDLIVRQVGKLKRDKGIQIENSEIEKRVGERWNQIAKELTLDTNFTSTILREVFNESKRVQNSQKEN